MFLSNDVRGRRPGFTTRLKTEFRLLFLSPHCCSASIAKRHDPGMDQGMHRRSFCSVETTLRFSMGVIFFFLLLSSRRPKTHLLWALAPCNIIPWSWEFTPGKPSSSSTQNPCMLTYRSSHKNHQRLVKYSFSVSLEPSRHPVSLRTTTMEPVT